MASRISRIGYVLFITLLCMPGTQKLWAQLLDPVTYSVAQIPETVAAGEIFVMEVDAEIEGEWHLYSVKNDPADGPYPTSFSSSTINMVIAGEVDESEATIVFDPNFSTELGWHSKSATFLIPLAFHPELSGRQNISVDVLYQVCDDISCLPPKTKTILSEIELTGSVTAGDPSAYSGFGALETIDQGTDVPVSFEFTSRSDLASESIWSFLWLAIVAGFAALLTPCVFPLIPLTVSYFSGDANKNDQSPWIQAIVFGLSIVLIFTLLGALLSLILGVSGVSQFASNPYVNTFIGAIFILFAMSMLGMFELRLPYQLTNWLNQKSNSSSGLAGTLFMALTVSAVSFSCTAPFVGAVLAATTTGEWFTPIVGMIGFSAALSSPFVLFAMFPNWLQTLPKSGAWMNSVKSVLAFIILAASVKFLANADIIFGWGFITRPLGIVAWITFFFLAGLYILGMYGLHSEKRPDSLSASRVMLSIPFFMFAFYLLPGLMGSSLGIWDAYLPARQVNEVSLVQSLQRASGSQIQSGLVGIATNGGDSENGSGGWSSNYDLSVSDAMDQDRPVFIDFTGYTCTNCKAMEANVFPDPVVQELFSKMEKVKLYTDGGSDADKNQAFQFDLTGTLALPTYAIVDPETGMVLDQLIGYTKRADFEAFLLQGLDRYRQVNESQ